MKSATYICATVLSLSGLVTACGEAPRGDDLVRLDLGTEIAAAALVGVSVDPLSGDRYVLDADLGIHRQRADGSFEMIWDAARTPEYGIELASAFTDFAALGEERFALTARNEGFLLDVAADTLNLHFCYLPGDIIFEDEEEEEDPEEIDPIIIIEPEIIEIDPGATTYEQLTLSLTYDADADLLYAQPRTISLEGETLMSHVAMFRRSNGYEQAWIDLDDTDFLAGAIVKVDENALLLSRDEVVYRYEIGAAQMTELSSLQEFGVARVEGMAIDGETLLIVDGASSELIEIPLSRF